jgi:hypothetical protein
MTWQHITIGEFDLDSPITETALDKVHNNQEELLTVPIDVPFSQVGHSEADWTELISRRIYIPPMLAVSPSTWQMTLFFERRMGGGTGDYYVRWRFNGGSWTELGPYNNTTYATVTAVISDGDVKLAALQGEVLFDIEGKIDTIFSVQVRNIESSVSAGRIERL